MTTSSPARFTLRDLPLASRLVLTVFLIAVGIGYFSALVQLHLQHSSKEGEALPTPADVVEVFAGLKRSAPGAPPAAPVSKLEKLVAGPLDAPFNGLGSMSAAFFDRDGPAAGKAGYKAQLAAGRDKASLDAEREGERGAVLEWIHLDPSGREKAHTDDAMPAPDDWDDRPITPAYLHPDGRIKVKSILMDRCVRCHSATGDQSQYPLQTYTELDKYLKLPHGRPAPPPGWEWSDRQIGIDKLTQSTHAHLLSFAVLFAFTGLIFSFTRFPAGVRAVVAPLVLTAEFADVACWWLARMPGSGMYFAYAIIGTGSAGGLGLLVQIVGGLWDMYGAKGRAVLGLVAAGVVGAFGLFLLPVLLTALAEERMAADRAKAAAPITVPGPAAPPEGSKVTELEVLVTGPRKNDKDVPWKRGGSMAAAFYEKSESWKADFEERGKDLEAEREGEQAAVAAWVRLDDAARKAAYEADKLPLPADRVGKPITADYLADDAHVRVKSILNDRCARCHDVDGDVPDFPLQSYEQFKKYFGPPPAAKK